MRNARIPTPCPRCGGRRYVVSAGFVCENLGCGGVEPLGDLTAQQMRDILAANAVIDQSPIDGIVPYKELDL